MPVQQMDFSGLSAQGDPLMAGLIPALQQGMQLKYMKPMMQNELQRQQLANSLSQVNLDYAPQMNQADLAYKQAQTPYLQSQTSGQDLQNALAQINLKNAPAMSDADLALKQAQIPFLQTKTQLMPASTLAQLLSGAGRYNQAAWQSSPNAQLIRTLNNPQMQNLISNNPDVGASVTQTLGNIGLGNVGGNTGNSFSLSNDMINSLASGLTGGQSAAINSSPVDTGQQSLAPWMMQQQGIPQQQASPQMMQSLMQGQQQGFQPSQQDINAVMGAAGDSFLKKTKTAQQLNQGTYASELDGLFQSGDSLMPSVVKYAGLLGKSKAGKDKVLAQFQQTDPDYKNYWNFTNVVAPNVANEMRRTLGGQATDYEGKLMKDLADPTYWDSNPELAMGQWNYLTNLYRTKINPALFATSSETNNRMRGNPTPQQVQQLTISPQQAEQLKKAGIAKQGQASGMISQGNSMPSQADLEYTAQKYGITVDQVKQKMGIS